MTSAEQYTAVASQLRAAAEKAANLWKQGAATLTEQADALAKLPGVDPAAGVQRYFELLQQAVDVNRELATKWAAAVNSMTVVLNEQSAPNPYAGLSKAELIAELTKRRLPKTGNIDTLIKRLVESDQSV